MLRTRPSLPVFMLASVVCSELAWIIRSDARLEDLARETRRQRHAITDVIAKRSAGVPAELPRNNNKSLEELVKELDLEDIAWAQSKPAPPKQAPPKQAGSPSPNAEGGWI